MGIQAGACGGDTKRLDKAIIFREQTIRYLDEGKRLKHFRLDAIVYVRPGRWGLNTTPSRPFAFIVGLEFKETAADLDRDTKCLYYLGWTDFFFLVVPEDLQDRAKKKVHDLGDARIGVITVGIHWKVVIIPLRQQVLPQNKFALTLQALLGEHTEESIDTIIDWNGIPDNGTVEVDAYFQTCCSIHPEFAGYEETYLANKQ